MSGLLIGTLILWLIIAIIVVVVVVYVVNCSIIAHRKRCRSFAPALWVSEWS